MSERNTNEVISKLHYKEDDPTYQKVKEEFRKELETNFQCPDFDKVINHVFEKVFQDKMTKSICYKEMEKLFGAKTEELINFLWDKVHELEYENTDEGDAYRNNSQSSKKNYRKRRESRNSRESPERDQREPRDRKDRFQGRKGKYPYKKRERSRERSNSQGDKNYNNNNKYNNSKYNNMYEYPPYPKGPRFMNPGMVQPMRPKYPYYYQPPPPQMPMPMPMMPYVQRPFFPKQKYPTSKQHQNAETGANKEEKKDENQKEGENNNQINNENNQTSQNPEDQAPGNDESKAGVIDHEAFSKLTPEQQKEVLEKRIPKKKVRCKKWPNCKDPNCEYAHPTETCPYFPTCAFKDKCCYIHPNIPCKYGYYCTRPNCAYSHPAGWNPSVRMYPPTGGSVPPFLKHKKPNKNPAATGGNEEKKTEENANPNANTTNANNDGNVVPETKNEANQEQAQS